jgi:Trk K+ transport system NAD-binding subunit
LLTHSKIGDKITKGIRNRLIKRELVKKVTFEELLVATGGYGISSVEVSKENPYLNKSLKDAGLRYHDINVLAIERDGRTIANPSADEVMLLSDRLICFGKLQNIRKELHVLSREGKEEASKK